jgi:hypothetical protein
MVEPVRLQDNLAAVRAAIREAAGRAGRDAEGIRLVAVTKGQPVEVIEALYSLGERHVGENRMPEGQKKASALAAHADIHWHMIGPLNHSDTVGLVKHFHYLHALTSLKIAARISEFSSYRGAPFPVLLEFNVSGEESKGGWHADDPNTWADLLPLVRQVQALPFLDVRGLMTMAPYSQNPEDARPVFAKLRGLRDFFNVEISGSALVELSMGMSGDYPAAVEEGATILRVGSALFE